LFNDKAQQKNKAPSHFARYRQIALILGKYRLEEILKYVGIRNYRIVGWLFAGIPGVNAEY